MCDLTAPQGVIGYEVRDGRRYEIVDLGTVIVTVLVDEIVTRPVVDDEMTLEEAL
mgnify:CR=1 FL=1|tara:strand:+ start:349 stop:513 length:165 start_codon:yes stop_codon:yes gene_type:complete